MHEWALAESLVVSVEKIAERENLKRVTSLKIKMGALQQIDKKIFKTLIKEIIKSKEIFKKTKIFLEEEKVLFKCENCKHQFSFQKNDFNYSTKEAIHFFPEVSYAFIKCPNCGSIDFSIEKGRNLEIVYLKGR